MTTSAIVGVAWEFAGVETVLACDEFIQPDHFFLGSLKLISGCQQQIREMDSLPAEEREDLPTLPPEIKKVCDRISYIGLDVDKVRRQLRQRRGQGAHQRKEGETLHRSEDSRRLFLRAGQVATQHCSTKLRWIHVLLVLLQESDAEGGARRFEVLREFGVDLAKLHAALQGLLSGPPAEERESYPEQSHVFEPETPYRPAQPQGNAAGKTPGLRSKKKAPDQVKKAPKLHGGGP